jgi:NAD(P)-dependent dehydrogenase (short-subunit alcohol dehydrogenase family)
MARTLEGKSALVTGGGGGFGKASAKLLARDGAAVTLTGRTLATLEKARDWLIGEVPDAKVAIIAGDAANEADVKAAIAKTIEHGGAIDIVVGVVGGGSGRGMIPEWSLDKLMGDYLVNVGSAFLVIQHATPLMKPGSSVVFISSTAAKMSFVGLSSYCAAKAGLDHFMRTAANELGAKGIRVNSVRPGLTHTDGLDAAFARPGYVDAFLPLIPLGRTGVPNDIAEAVRFLAGPEAAWLTGQTFAVDGGQETRMNPLPAAS